MRTISIVKASLFTLILVLMVIGTIAIAEVMKKEQPVVEERAVVMDTWYFIGEDPLEPSDYSDDPIHASQCEPVYEQICQILAPTNGSGPDLTANINGRPVRDHIQDALDALPSELPPASNDVVLSYKSD